MHFFLENDIFLKGDGEYEHVRYVRVYVAACDLRFYFVHPSSRSGQVSRVELYVYVCMCLYVCVCVYVWTCGGVDVWTCGRVDVWTCGRVYVRTCVRVYVCTCVRVYACTRVRVYVRTCVRVNVCTCVRVHVIFYGKKSCEVGRQDRFCFL